MERSITKRLPPYVSYRTFRNFLDYLKEGMPDRIDRSYWGDKLSGSRGIQLITTLKFLQLIGNDNRPTDILNKLVHSEGDERREILSGITHKAYAWVFENLDVKRATQAQLKEKFKDINPNVARKCIAFFISIANDAGIPLSSFILKKTKVTWAATRPRKLTNKEILSRPQPASEKAQPVVIIEDALLGLFPKFDLEWSDEKKEQWFRDFTKLRKALSDMTTE